MQIAQAIRTHDVLRDVLERLTGALEFVMARQMTAGALMEERILRDVIAPLEERVARLARYADIDGDTVTELELHMRGESCLSQAQVFAPGAMVGFRDAAHVCYTNGRMVRRPKRER